MSNSKFGQGQHKLQTELTSDVNYFQWSRAVKDQLRTQGILDKSVNKYTAWLTTALPPQDNNALVEWQAKQVENELVKLLITYNLSTTLYNSIDATKDAKTIWDLIAKICIPNKANHILLLKSQLAKLTMGQSAQEYLLQIDEKVKQINELQDEFLNESDIISFIQNGLPIKYKIHTKCMWLERDTHTSETLKQVIINYHIAQTSCGPPEDNAPEANFSRTLRDTRKRDFQTRRKSLTCNHCPNLRNHSTEDCWKVTKKPKFCNFHNSRSHSNEECRSKREANLTSSMPVTPIQFKDDEGQSTAGDWAFTCGNIGTYVDTLTYDSACTTHLIMNKNLLFDFKTYSGEIKVANNNIMAIKHCAKMKLPGTTDIIDVLYCPEAIRNLISAAALSTIGYTATLHSNGTGTLQKGNSTLQLQEQHGVWIIKHQHSCSHTKLQQLMHRR